MNTSRLVVLSVALLAPAAALAVAQTPSRGLEAAHAALAAARYEQAIGLYRREREGGSRWAWLTELTQTIEQRRDLGDVAPADTHRIAVVFVVRTTVIRSNGTSEPRADVTEEQKALWRSRLGALRRVIEAFSEGGWSLAFDEVEAGATVGEGTGRANPDDLDLEDYVRRSADSIDTYVIVSNHIAGRGGGFVEPMPFANYAVRGAQRGVIWLHARNHGFQDAATSFFHVMERVAGIMPLRGHRDSVRHHFPEWRGTTDYDYYRWTFRNTLAGVSWGHLNHRHRWRLRPDRDRAMRRVAAAYETISREARLEARRLAQEARRLPRAEFLRAAEIYERALSLSPYDIQVVFPLLSIYRNNRIQPGRQQLLESRGAELQTITDITEAPPPVASPLVRAHAAFAAGRWDEAAAQYQRARELGAERETATRMLEALEVRRRLGDIAPADTHRIGVICVTDIDTYTTLSRAERTTRSDVVADQRPSIRLRLGVLRRLIESFSAGGTTLDFEESEAVAYLDVGTRVTSGTIDRIDAGRYLLESSGRVDSYMVISNSSSPGLGGARWFSLVTGVIRGPQRGFVNINPTNHDVELMLHEFFHVVEAASGIAPGHGYRDELRSNFPQWQGSGEFDYYRWHFNTTLAGGPWSRLNFRLRNPVSTERMAAYARIASAYERIPFDSVLQAADLAQVARALPRVDSARSLALLERAVALSPYQPDALSRLADSYRSRPEARERYAEYTERLATLRAAR